MTTGRDDALVLQIARHHEIAKNLFKILGLEQKSIEKLGQVLVRKGRMCRFRDAGLPLDRRSVSPMPWPQTHTTRG